MENETWKKIIIDGTETVYEINMNGDIQNKYSKHVLSPNINNNGLVFCNGLIGEKQHSLYIHKLLAECFVPNPNNYDIAYHIDGNKGNNEISNIGWTNRSEAVARGHATKKHTKKVNQYSDAEKTKIIATFDSVMDASEKIGIHKRTISSILTGKANSKKYFLGYA